MRIFIKILIAILVLLVFGVLYFMNSPRPVTNFLKKSFEEGLETPAPDYEQAKLKTTTQTNIDFNSKYENGKLDIIWYKEKKSVPTIFWIHGGAYVGGDKKDITKYLTYIASHGYNIVNINYVLAPNEQFPAQLKQIDEAYRFIKKNEKKYKLELSRVYIGGDSAGGHIASQFTAIQMNKGYLPSAKIRQSVNPSTIRGVILLCAPYDVKAVAENGSKQTRFIFNRVGWALFGDRNWKDKQEANESSLLHYVPKKFPAVFITDGNSGSFEEQGKEFAKLMSKRTTVKQVFYPKEVKLGHEYQFLMDTEPAQKTFKELVTFLKETE